MSSLQKPNQTTNNGTNYIDSLPVEILCMVFDGLDLHSVKNASLVCKRWNNIIFYSGYAARFVLTINVWIMYYPDVKEMGKHEIKRLRDTAEYSQRYYRKLNCAIHETNNAEYKLLLDALFTNSHLTKNLHSLTLSRLDGISWRCMFASITNFIPMMPHLRSLMITKPPHVENQGQENGLVILRSSSVRYLEVNNIDNIRIDMPQVQTFKGPLCILYELANSLVLGNLKHLIISKDFSRKIEGNATPTELSTIRQLKHLESIEFAAPVAIEVYITICETCTELKGLTFAIGYIAAEVLMNLPKLINLRRILYKTHSGAHPENNLLHLDLSPVVNLKQVELPLSRQLRSLILPKSVKILALWINTTNLQNLIQIITDYSMQLTELTLVSDWYGHGVWPEILNILPKMEKLEVLVFTNVTVLKSNFLCMDTPMNRLRKLEFRRCYLETKLILGLKDKFPNAFINFSNCDMLCVY